MAIDSAALAIDFQGEPITWGAMTDLVNGIEDLLSEAGIGPGAPIALLLRNRPEMVAAVLATVVSDRCIVCVNPLQGDAKLATDLESLRAPVLLATAEDWQSPSARAGAERAGSMAIVLDRKADPAVRWVPGLERLGPGPHRPTAPGIAVEMLTSGTTGPPKRIQLRTDAFEKSLLGASHYESNRSEAPSLQKSFALVSGPLVHIGGMFHCVKSAVDGRPVCLLERFAVDDWVDAVRRHRPKVTGLVPSAIKMVMDADISVEDLASLRAVTTGTAPLAPELQLAFEDRYGIPVLITYGATEFAGAVAGWTIHDHRAFGASKRGSVGRAHPGCELRVVDPESGDVLGLDETGLLEVLSEQAESKGWVRTSDQARIDADAFVWIEGRADGAINRGGFKIDPAAVARALELHPAIREAAVVGLPDDRLGEVPVAVYELSEGATPPSAEELFAFAKEHLTRYFVPTQIRAVEAIPRTPSLKPSLPALRALFLEE
jgi:acyl-coenzyme A synthetase/AMP-(fatty) acid ligase